MKDLSDRISNLSPEKRAALQEMLLRKKNGKTVFQSIPRRSEQNFVPLSFAQERMWILNQLEPDNAFYNLSWALRISDFLDISALEKSFDAIRRRHEILRTTFSTKNEMPVQTIAPPSALPLPVIPLEDMQESEQSTEIQRLAAREAGQPFDLTTGPLLRVTLLRLNSEAHVLLLTMHHIISDGWSIGIFIREMTALYETFLIGKNPPFSELPIQYADFAVWQREFLSGDELEKQLDYWKKQLADIPPVLELPWDRPRPAEQAFCGASEHFQISRELTDYLKALSKTSGATLFMTLLAAFATLLSRYTGQEDIVVGSPVANRNREETERLIGFFVNTLVLRTDLSGNPAFTELLAKIKQITLGAYAHQDMPFSRLVEALQPERDMSHTPLFQVMFVLQNMPLGKLEGAGAKVEVMETETLAAQFDLILEISETPSGLKGMFTYNTDLFDSDRIRRMVGHFETLLKNIAANPESLISELDILTDAERHQLLVKFNDTGADYPRDKTIVDLFEEQVEKTPGNVAVIFDDVELTYRELNERANRVAHFLRDEYHILPDDRVGLLLERSEWMIVGIMGILKAGGAYVPVDPMYPSGRILHMVSDSGSKVVLSESGIAKLAESNTKIADIRNIRHENISNLERSASPHDLAYVIYTSGSTGAPKGVLIEHGNLYDYVMTFTKEFRVSSQDRFLQHTAITFDVSVEEIYGALCMSATLVLFGDSNELDALFSCVLRRGITILSLSPPAVAYFNMRADELGDDLRVLISGGDVLYPSSADKLLKKTSLCNAYGPTETTVSATFYRDGNLQGQTVPVGRPIANRRIYILDEKLNPVPPGVSGEICISGAGTARGYLNQDKLTAKKFVNNPFEPGKRLYRTGDMGRYLPDGNIEFLGRNDDQVKIRGYRIELGEIEKYLLSHRDVREAVVVAKAIRKEDSDRELTAYITSPDDLNASILREHLKTMLPGYMIPSYFVRLEKMPLNNSSGKVDKKALPDPKGTEMKLGTEHIAPRNETERKLADIWQEVLGIEKVGIRDNFFDLGGHSLKAVQMMNQVRKELGAEIALKEIFSQPTIEVLGRHIRSGDSGISVSPNLSHEAMLDPEIRLNTPSPVTTPHEVLLTGASGFMGAFLLKELLHQTEARIHCLIRASDREEGRLRIEKALREYCLWEGHESNRVVPIVGNLSEPLLGLSSESFARLTEKIDVVYHNAALVNFLYPYNMLKKPNVVGTQEMLRLACRNRAKPFHFVSTVSVLGNQPHLQNETEMEAAEGLEGGYSQSKWVAEKLVMEAWRRGLPVCVYRPSLVVGATENGRWNQGDFASRLIKGCVQLGAVPDIPAFDNMIPADTAAAGIVHISRQASSFDQKIFHVVNPSPVSWGTFTDFIRERGYPMRTMSYAQWRKTLIHNCQNNGDNALQSLLPLFSNSEAEDMTSPFFPTAEEISIPCENFLDGLRGSPIVIPEISHGLLEKYFEHFEKSGFLAREAMKSLPAMG